MKSIWEQSFQILNQLSLSDLKKFTTDELLYKALPHFVMELMHKYFRLEIEGAEHLPKKGAGLIIPNHSGYAGVDAMLLNHEIYKITGRTPRVLTHHLWFFSPTVAVPVEKLGFIEATTANGLKALKKKELVVLFPEGEYGNFKPSVKAYRLQEFKRGFVRMALKTKSPIIPTLVIGAEETHINLSQLKMTRFLRGLVLPLPLNVIPLPVKWKIKFLPPVVLPFEPEAANDRELVHEIASDMRERMQKALNQELKKRGRPF